METFDMENVKINDFSYPVEGGIWKDNQQIKGSCDKPFRFTVGALVREGKISWYKAKKEMLRLQVYGVYASTKLGEI